MAGVSSVWGHGARGVRGVDSTAVSAESVWFQDVVQPAERSRVIERSSPLLAVVSGAVRGGELNERLGAGQGVDELRCGGADVVIFGVADPASGT